MILPEYLETVFVGEPPAGGWPPNFYIITAYNPHHVATKAEQDKANALLEKDLKAEQLQHFKIMACSPDFVHQELSWVIVGIPWKSAIELGREYNQNAIIEVIKGEAFIISCESLVRRAIGPFESRVFSQKQNAVSDPVNHPGHYNQHPSGVECVTIAQEFQYNLGCAIKYIWRSGLKSQDPIEDLRKAQKYIEFEISRLSAK
jgi:Protein of unknown function (DUF3293)/Protein of unknwon function (DUF3310)